MHGAHRRLSAEMVFIELVSQRIRKVTPEDELIFTVQTFSSRVFRDKEENGQKLTLKDLSSNNHTTVTLSSTSIKQTWITEALNQSAHNVTLEELIGQWHRPVGACVLLAGKM